MERSENRGASRSAKARNAGIYKVCERPGHTHSCFGSGDLRHFPSTFHLLVGPYGSLSVNDMPLDTCIAIKCDGDARTHQGTKVLCVSGDELFFLQDPWLDTTGDVDELSSPTFILACVETDLHRQIRKTGGSGRRRKPAKDGPSSISLIHPIPRSPNKYLGANCKFHTVLHLATSVRKHIMRERSKGTQCFQDRKY